MSDTEPIRVSGKMKDELEETKENGDHTSLDSALREWYRAWQMQQWTEKKQKPE